MVGLTCLTVPKAAAVAFRLPNQDPEAIARGNAFAATADNPSAIYYNPAGITQLDGQNVSAGLYLISAGDTFEGANGGSAKTKSEFQAVPQIYYVFTPKEFPLPLSFGVGVYVPYGLSLDWGNNNPFRDVAQNGSLLYATVNPVVAWKVTDQFSIAIGPTINYSKADFNQDVLGTASQFHFVGDDFAFGFTAGARWQPCDYFAFGLNYRYMTTMDYKGHSSTTPALTPISSTPTTASLRFPQNVVAGISIRPTDKWNLEVDVDYTDWDNVNQLSFNGTPLGNLRLPLNYQSGFMYDFGVTRKLPKGYFASVGYIYSENSSPNQFYNPIIPDSSMHLGNIGFGHKGQRWGWALSYTIAINPGRTVTNDSFDGGVPGAMVDGVYRTINHAINISTSFKF